MTWLFRHRFPGDLQLLLVPFIVPDVKATRNFFRAVQMGKQPSVEAFLQEPIDPDIVNRSGHTALHEAAAHSHFELVRLLLEAGADKDKEAGGDRNGWVPLNFCEGDPKVLRLLLDAAANPDGKTTPPLQQAVEIGHLEMVKLLLNAGAKVELPTIVPSALLAAAKADQTEVLRLLLQARANPDRASCGETPLVAAARKGNTAVVRLLLDFGADKDQMAKLPARIPSFSPRTALSEACEAGREEVVRLLLSVGASKDQNQGCGLGFGKLVRSCKIFREHFPSCRCLMMFDLKNQSEFLLNPLSNSSDSFQPRFAEDKSSDPMDLPLTAASRAGKLRVVNLLLEAGDHLDKVGGLNMVKHHVNM